MTAARERQQTRYTQDGIRTNAELAPAQLGRYSALEGTARKLLDSAAVRMTLSARGFDRVRKVARTLADLAGVDRVDADHVAEALQFRMI